MTPKLENGVSLSEPATIVNHIHTNKSGVCTESSYGKVCGLHFSELPADSNPYSWPLVA
jgi:hypothetical protein